MYELTERSQNVPVGDITNRDILSVSEGKKPFTMQEQTGRVDTHWV